MMHMDISIEEKAKKFMKEKGNVLTISRLDIRGGCVSIEEVEVTYKAPKIGRYEKYEYDDLIIYVQKGLQFKENHIKIIISGIGPFKTITAGSLYRGI